MVNLELVNRFYARADLWQDMINRSDYVGATTIYQDIIDDRDFLVMDSVLKGYAYHQTATALVYAGRGEEAMPYFKNAWETFPKSRRRHAAIWTSRILSEYLGQSALETDQPWLVKLVGDILYVFNKSYQGENVRESLHSLLKEFREQSA